MRIARNQRAALIGCLFVGWISLASSFAPYSQTITLLSVHRLDFFCNRASVFQIGCSANEDDCNHLNDSGLSRRYFLQQSVFLPILVEFANLQSCGAAETPVEASIEGEPSQAAVAVLPYATSIQALIPAVRVRKMMDRSVGLTQQWLSLTEASTQRSEILQQLQELLLQKQNFMSNITMEPRKAFGTVRPDKTLPKAEMPSPSYLDLYNQRRNNLNLWEKPGAFFVQGGEIGTWKALKQKEFKREGADEIRAAMNLYTSNLVFTSTQYTLRVSKEKRSQMIREDRLPDILTQVVPSDMDLRDLYRNALLTAVQESRAELRYQVSDANQETIDLTDLLQLLRQGQEALNQWFSFIDPKEVTDACLADAYE